MKTIASFALAAFLPTLGASALATAAAQPDITLKTQFGSSLVLSYSWGASNSGTLGSGGGGAGAGRVSNQDLHITRSIDAMSSKLMGAVETGRILRCVELTMGALKFTLNEVLVSSYQVGASSADKAGAQEQISFNFAALGYSVDGADFATGPVTACP
jgi:type VI protein secretion system component Hcp